VSEQRTGTPSGRHAAAMQVARSSPASLVPHLVTPPEIRRIVHGDTPVGRFNNRLAVLITRVVGTMWAAYVFAMIAFVSFPQAFAAFQAGNMLVAITWLSQSFLQLVLLPIIMVGQNVISAAQDARAEADHETLTALHTINVRELEILERQERILEALRERGPDPARSPAP
jgi:hypothetical protein